MMTLSLWNTGEVQVQINGKDLKIVNFMCQSYNWWTSDSFSICLYLCVKII